MERYIETNLISLHLSDDDMPDMFGKPNLLLSVLVEKAVF